MFLESLEKWEWGCLPSLRVGCFLVVQGLWNRLRIGQKGQVQLNRLCLPEKAEVSAGCSSGAVLDVMSAWT